MAAAYVLGGLSLAAVAATGVAGAAGTFISCLCLGGASAGALALGASLYPTIMRSTGLGAAISMGRLGQVAKSLTVGVMLNRGLHSMKILGLVPLLVIAAAVMVVVMQIMPPATESAPMRTARPTHSGP